MKLSQNMNTELDLSDSSTISIAAMNTNFDVSEKTPVKKSGLSGAAQSINDDFVKAGFRMVGSPIEFSNIGSTRKNLTKGFKGERQDSSHARVEVAVEPGYEAVVLELDPATSEVLGWVLPVAKTEPTSTVVKSMAHGIASTRIANSAEAIFELPLNNPNVINNRISAEKSFNIGKLVAKKLFQIVVIKMAKKLARKAIKFILKQIDKTRGKDDRLWAIDIDGSLTNASDARMTKMEGEKVLLFVHGIISSTNVAFSKLFKKPQNTDFFGETEALYGKNYIGYEHWTLSKNITKNAEEMLKKLPKNTTIDIVCHSRGAGVVRSLLENPKFRGRIEKKKIKFDKVCFVAGACEGSPLASDEALNRLFRVINTISVLTGAGSIGSSTISLAIKAFLGGVQNAPGIDSMDPDGKEIQALKKSKSTKAKYYNYARANFDSSKWYVSAADQVLIDSTIFDGKPNDTVVPYIKAGPHTSYLKNASVKKAEFYTSGSRTLTNPDIWHINFFQDVKFRKKLIETLNKI